MQQQPGEALDVPTLAFQEQDGCRGLSCPLDMCLLASAGGHLSKIIASSLSFRIEITIFNKWSSLTCVQHVISLGKNSLFFLSIGAVGYRE